MSATYPLTHGYVIIIATPRLGGGVPMYRGYIVAEDDQRKAEALVSAHVDADESLHAVGQIPGPALQALQLQPGMTMRL